MRPGAYLIGTTIDSDELIYRIRNTNKNTIGNNFYKVVCPTDRFEKNKSAFGHKYYFYLKDAIGKESFEQARLVDEFLIIWEKMIEVAE